jgi:hypothetical protein
MSQTPNPLFDESVKNSPSWMENDRLDGEQNTVRLENEYDNLSSDSESEDIFHDNPDIVQAEHKADNSRGFHAVATVAAADSKDQNDTQLNEEKDMNIENSVSDMNPHVLHAVATVATADSKHQNDTQHNEDKDTETENSVSDMNPHVLHAVATVATADSKDQNDTQHNEDKDTETENSVSDMNPHVLHAVAAVAAADSKHQNDTQHNEDKDTETENSVSKDNPMKRRFNISGDRFKKIGSRVMSNIRGKNEGSEKMDKILKQRQNIMQADYEKQIKELQQKLALVEQKQTSDSEQQQEYILNSKSVQSFIPIFNESIQVVISATREFIEKAEVDITNVNMILKDNYFPKMYKNGFDENIIIDFNLLESNIPHALPMKENIKIKLIYFLSNYKYNQDDIKYDEKKEDKNCKIECMFFKLLFKFHQIYLEIKDMSYDESVDFVNQNMMQIPQDISNDFMQSTGDNTFEAKKLLLLYVIHNLVLNY